MGAIKCDTDSLENKVNANLKKGKNSLEEGANILESISIPSSFSHYSTLSRMPSTIKDNEENLNGFQKWIKDIIDKFTGADNATRSAIDRLTDDFNSFDLGNGQMTMVQEEEELNPFEQIGKSITDFWNSLWGENEDLQNTNANVSNSYETPVSLVTQISNGWNSMVQNVQDGLNTANDAIVDGWNNFTKSVSDWFNQAGEVVQNTFDKISETASSIAFKIREVTQTVVSSVVIGVGSILKGITEFVESLVDAVAILGTATWTFLVFVTDTVLYLGGAENKSWDDYIRYISTNSLTMRMWKGVMGFVSTQYVNNAWNDLFEHTAAGQYLDSHAIGIFKHDGIGSQISSGIGYVAGIVIATILTGGAAGVGAAASASSSATISTGIASVAALGKYTSESWNEDKASSWLGIEESYKNGEISQEDYEAMVQIRNLSDEEWQNVYNSYLAGEITEEQYLSMKNIREMPEDWRTVSNLGSGLAYGAASAAWEGIQWYVGGKLAGVNFSSRAVGTAVNLGTDTVFNSFDTPYRAAIDSITSGQDFAKAFEEQGGWSGVLSNALIGLVASGAGEFFSNKIKVSNIKENVQIDENIQDQFTNLDDIYGYNPDYLFEITQKANGYYGVDQGVLKDLYAYETPDGKIINGREELRYITYRDAGIPLRKFAQTQEYIDLKKWIQANYKLSARESAAIITMLDSVGACSYAELCNEFIMYFTKSKELSNIFLEKYGFPIIELTEDSKVKINDKKLILDMFITVNDLSNGGNLIITLPNESKIIDWTVANTDKNGYVEIGD